MPARLQRIGILLAAAVLGALLGLFGLMVLSSRGRLPPVTPERFQDARERWETHGPSSYRIQVAVTGRQPATYAVEVRQGRTITATRNGQPLKQERTRSTWSVPGMFGTLQTDVNHLARRASDPQDASNPSLSVRVAFHPRYGFPERYHRTEYTRMGANVEVSWAVTLFEVLDEADPTTEAESDSAP